MTLKDFLSSLGTLNVQVIVKDSEGTMICKIYSNSVASLEESLSNTKIKHWSIVKATLLTVILQGDEPEPEPEPQVISVESVSLNTNVLTLGIGNTDFLEATVYPEDAGNKSVNWIIADDGIVSFEESTGVVTALAIGTTSITVVTVDGNFTDVCEITVE